MGSKYGDRDDYAYGGRGEEVTAAVGISEGSLEEALVRAAEHARTLGLVQGHRLVIADIAIEIGPNPPISEYRVTLAQVHK